MDEELKNLIQGAKSQGASDNDIKKIIDLYIADSKKKGVTQPISPKKQLESPAQQTPTPTSLDTEETQPPAVSDGLGGPPKMKTFTGFTPEEQQTLQAKPVPKISKSAALISKKLRPNAQELATIKVTPENQEEISRKTDELAAAIKEQDRLNKINFSKLDTEFNIAGDRTNAQEIAKTRLNDALTTTGLWNNIKATSLNVYNKLVEEASAITDEPGIKQLKADLDPLSEEKKETLKEAAKNKIKLTDIELEERAKQLYIDKQTDFIVSDNLTSFLDNIDEKDQNLLKQNRRNLAEHLQENNLKEEKVINSYESIGNEKIKEYKAIEQELLKYKNSNQALPKDMYESYVSLGNEIVSIGNNIQKRQSIINKNKEDLGTAKQEFDLLKRRYGDVDNALTNIGLGGTKILNGILGFTNYMSKFAGGPQGELRSLAGQQVTDKINNYIANEESQLRKSVESIESVEGFINYASDILSKQIPNLVATSTGIGGLGVIGISSTGEKYTEMNREVLEGKATYSPLQMAVAPALWGSAEVVSEIPTLSILTKGARVFDAIVKNEGDLIKKSVKEKAKEWAKDWSIDTSKEVVGEEFTNFAQNFTDKYVLGKKDVGLLDNAGTVFKDTVTLTSILKAAPHVAGAILKPHQNNRDLNILDENSKKIIDFSKQLENESLNDTERAVITKQIDKATAQNSKIIANTIDKVNNMPDEVYKRIIDLNNNIADIKTEAVAINDGDLPNKAELIKSLESDYRDAQTERNALIDAKYESPIQKEFDKLENNEKIKLKDKASRILMEEAKSKGLKQFEFNDQAITDKAVELFKQTVSEEEIVLDLEAAEKRIAKQAEVTPTEEIVSNEVANIEAKRQKELKKYDERDNKSLEQITPKNPNHEILQVGQKWDAGYNAEVQNFTDERITDEEGVQVVTKVIEAGEYDSDGKMTKIPVVEVTTFDNKEQADKYIEDKYNKIKKIIEEQKAQKKVNAKYDAELEAIEDVVPTEEVATEEIKPIRKLGNGSNVYFETEKHRLNENQYGDKGKYVLNVGEKGSELPKDSLYFDDLNEAISIAKKIETDFPNGVPDAILLDKVIENYKKEVTPAEEVISPEPIATEPVTEKAVTKPKTIKYNNAEYFKNEVGNWVNVKTGNEVKGIGIKGIGKKLIEELNQIERNPDRKYRLTDKGQLFNVKLNKGILEVTNDKGEKVSKTTERAVLRKHIDNFDFTQGEKAIDRPDISGRPEDYNSEIATKSNNPFEVAQTIIYAEEFKDNKPRDIEVETDLNEQKIAAVIDKVTKESFIEYGDINLIKGNEKQYRGWFNKNGKSIDELITDYIGEDSGVSHQDVVDFMTKYKSKADFYRKFKENISDENIKKINDLIDLKAKFTKLTGLNPTSEFLRKAIDQQNRKSELNSILDQLTDEELQQRYEEQSEIIPTTEGVIKIEDNKARRAEEPVVEGNKEQAFRDKVKDIPESGKVSKYLSGETIERVEGEAPRNIQDIDVMPLVEAGVHGRETVAMAKEVYGDKYIEKTLEFLDTANLKTHEKALLYVSLENEMFDLVNSEPKNVGFKKLQDLVRAKSQQFLRESSLAINMGRLRAIMKDGFNYESITDGFLSKDQLAGKKAIEKAIQSDSNAIQNEYESMVKESDIEQLILSGVEKQINEIYKKLPTARRVKADKAIAALERIQKRLKGKAYDATIGLPIALIDSGITVIKNSIKAGVNIADAIELGINYIKEKYGKDWANEGMFRDDMIEEFKSEGISEKEINVKDLSKKQIVDKALIDAGFGKEITVKGEKRNVLDWKKLAGEEGSVEKIRENVEKIIGEESAKELEDEYNNLRASIIEKSLNELERRNIPRKKVNLKTSAKKLAEIYNYGAFEKDSDTYDQVMNTVLGMNQLDQKSFNEAKKLARSLSELFSKKDKNGNPISQESLKQGERVINKKIERLLSKVAWSESNGLYKAVTIAKEYIGAAQRAALVSIGQAIENTMSGYVSRIYNKIGFSIDNVDTKSLKESRNKLARMTFKDITLGGGLEFGDVTSPFITKSKTMDLIQNASDSRLYHVLASTALGKPFLEAADSMHKSALTAKFFQYNLIKILRKKGYSKLEAKNYVSEQLTGQSFEDALVDSKKIIDEINQNAGKKVIPDTEESIYRFANDLVNESLIQGQKVNIEEIRAALKAAETVAGFELGHEPNNIVSKPINLFNSWIQTRIDRAVKDKKWNDAAALTTASILSGNILNPFIGGGMNWTFLGMQKVGIPTPATMYWNIKARSNKLDISSDEGMKNLEQTLKYQLLAKNANTRVVIGATISLAAFALASATGADDDLYKWLKKNAWANKYFAKVSPPVVQYMVAEKNKKMSEFFGKQLNLKVDAFDEGKKIKQAIDNIASGKTQKALGGVGQLAGSRLSTPVVPWRLVRDVSDIYRGLNGLPAIKHEYKASGFASGYFQGGMIEQLGLRPENTYEISDEELRIKNPRRYEIRMRLRRKRNK